MSRQDMGPETSIPRDYGQESRATTVTHERDTAAGRLPGKR
jgi:hypothetical protein